jgi:hypothetical protein
MSDKPIVEYDIAVSELSYNHLVRVVNRKIEQGWEPHGQPFETTGTSSILSTSYRQAMVRRGTPSLQRPSADVLTGRR